MSRVVVAGGAGFLGSHLCDLLIARGDDVVCLDDLSTGTEDNLADLRGHERFSLVVTDISEKVELEDESKVDAVCNLASPASPPAYLARPFDSLAVGSEGTRRLLESRNRGEPWNPALTLLAHRRRLWQPRPGRRGGRRVHGPRRLRAGRARRQPGASATTSAWRPPSASP